ncbi:FAD-dependent oxidoreductase [Sinorhizobium fredii]|uniref:FAD-dependent oxidoreductase n=1 Tax=Rhizobium fredii TaxID=380 RepID=UPI003515FEB1
MRVLIAGAGIAGLSAARALEAKGIECEVVERREQPPTEGAGIFLLGNAARALGDLRLLDEVRSVAYPIATQRILSSSGFRFERCQDGRGLERLWALSCLVAPILGSNPPVVAEAWNRELRLGSCLDGVAW